MPPTGKRKTTGKWNCQKENDHENRNDDRKREASESR